jgi:hypothetical protein
LGLRGRAQLDEMVVGFNGQILTPRAKHFDPATAIQPTPLADASNLI